MGKHIASQTPIGHLKDPKSDLLGVTMAVIHVTGQRVSK